jgi:hypothetical protein
MSNEAVFVSDDDVCDLETTPPSVPQTPVAIPPVKAKKWQGNGWQGQ